MSKVVLQPPPSGDWARKPAPISASAGSAKWRTSFQVSPSLEQWKAKAKQYRESQSGRSRLELIINRSPSFAIGLALGIPFVAMIVWLIRR